MRVRVLKPFVSAIHGALKQGRETEVSSKLAGDWIKQGYVEEVEGQEGETAQMPEDQDKLRYEDELQRYRIAQHHGDLSAHEQLRSLGEEPFPKGDMPKPLQQSTKPNAPITAGENLTPPYTPLQPGSQAIDPEAARPRGAQVGNDRERDDGDDDKENGKGQTGERPKMVGRRETAALR